MSLLKVEMLPAGPGDGLWIEWGPARERHRMIIDGGTRKQARHVRGRLERLREEGGNVDLLVITHIDLDHIEVPIELLASPVPDVELRDVWFNDYHHLPADRGNGEEGESKDRGPRQGEQLGALLGHRGQDSNKHFGGGAVVVEDGDGDLEPIELDGGLVLYLLSPTSDKLEALAGNWRKWAKGKKAWTPGDREAALRDLGSRVKEEEEESAPLERGSGEPRCGHDSSAANGSSIAFIAEYEGERWLFSGDAHDDILRLGLDRFPGKKKQSGRVRLDGFKLPHHGSVNNISAELLDMVDCDRYLISTDGTGHQHPDEGCIDLIVEKNERPELVFNYFTDHTRKWEAGEEADAIYLYDPDDSPRPGPLHAKRSMTDSGADVGESTRVAPSSADAATEAPRPKLQVSVVWGDITLVTDDVLSVGHYEGVLPQEAELALERLVSDVEDPVAAVTNRNENPKEYEKLVITAMSRRNMLSGRLGEITFLPVTGKEHRLIALCGMGPFALFNIAKLRLLYRNLAWSLNALPDPRSLGTVLIGGGVSGIGVQDAVEQMLNGFGDVLSTSADEKVWNIRVVELQRQKAKEIHKALRDLKKSERLLVDVENEPEWIEGDGRRASPEYAVSVIVDAVTRLPPKETRTVDEILERIDQKEFEISGLRENITQVWALGSNKVSEMVKEALGVGVLKDLDVSQEEKDQRNGSDLLYPTRISILSDTDNDVLRATVITKDAAVPERVMGADKKLIVDLARRMTQPDPADIEELGLLLHGLVVPRDFREYLGDENSQTPLLFEVDRHTALVHWEMLVKPGMKASSTDVEVKESAEIPIGLLGPVARQLRTSYSASAGLSLRKGKHLQALVIGDPGRDEHRLPGASREAERVAELLEKTELFSNVYKAIGPPTVDGSRRDSADRLSVLAKLLRGEIDVIHFAGHGTYDLENPQKTGWVFADGLLTARELESVDNAPALVFANACVTATFSGTGGGDSDVTKPRGEEGLLPSLADEFFNRGVRNYIGTAWNVDDDGAIRFATEFYEGFFRRKEDIGTAMFKARKKVGGNGGSYKSLWAAYQHYGDPGFRHTDL